MSAQFLEVHEQLTNGEGPARLINIATITEIRLSLFRTTVIVLAPNMDNAEPTNLMVTATYAELRHALASAGLVAIPIPGATGGL